MKRGKVCKSYIPESPDMHEHGVSLERDVPAGEVGVGAAGLVPSVLSCLVSVLQDHLDQLSLPGERVRELRAAKQLRCQMY